MNMDDGNRVLTIDEIKSVVPRSSKNNITPEFVDMINNCGKGMGIEQAFRDNFVSYSSVLQTGKYKLSDYMKAVQYVTYKMLGKSMKESWMLTFPDRYEALKDADDKTVSSHVSMYNSGKLVTAITQQTLIPAYVLHSDLLHEALGTLAGVMRSPSSSDRNKIEACKAIMDVVKQPENASLSIDIEMNTESIVDGFKSAISELSKVQLGVVNSGAKTLIELVESPIIEVER